MPHQLQEPWSPWSPVAQFLLGPVVFSYFPTYGIFWNHLPSLLHRTQTAVAKEDLYPKTAILTHWGNALLELII